MPRIEILRNRQIKDSLRAARRQYLVGDLQLPQTLDFFRSKNLEVGISSYKNFESESPHRHSEVTEYQYVLSGQTKYLDVDSGVEYDFKAGDFYVIHPGTSYAQKSKPGTEILFIKVPAVNDKEPLEVTASTQSWMDTPITTVRKDYSSSQGAPAPNSIKPAAAVAIIRENQVLLVRRNDNSKWSLPGGTQDFGESLPACAIREIAEETSLKVNIVDILGTYTNPDIRIAYSDGEVRQEFTVVFIGKTQDSEVYLDSESSEYRWVLLSELQSLDVADSQRVRLNHLIQYLEEGTRNFG